MKTANGHENVDLTAIAREAKRIDTRARRAAERVGWLARKSRWRAGTIDNYGGFAIIDPFHNNIVYGWQFDCTAEDVIEICSPDAED
jgi:hypothetical protein